MLAFIKLCFTLSMIPKCISNLNHCVDSVQTLSNRQISRNLIIYVHKKVLCQCAKLQIRVGVIIVHKVPFYFIVFYNYKMYRIDIVKLFNIFMFCFSSLTLLWSVRLHSVAHLYNVCVCVGFSPGYPILIGCYKSCHIRIIDDIIVSCQQV